MATSGYVSFASIYASLPHANHAAGICRMKCSSSYLELRLGNDGVWSLASPEVA